MISTIGSRQRVSILIVAWLGPYRGRVHCRELFDDIRGALLPLLLHDSTGTVERDFDRIRWKGLWVAFHLVRGISILLAEEWENAIQSGGWRHSMLLFLLNNLLSS